MRRGGRGEICVFEGSAFATTEARYDGLRGAGGRDEYSIVNQRLSKLMYTEEGATEVSRAFFLVAEARSKSLMKEVGFRETISSVMKVMKLK